MAVSASDPASNFAYHVLKSVKENSKKTLLHIGHESVTGEQFHERVTATVNLLKWKGVVPNDRVLMTIQPSIDFYAVAVGVFAVGGSLVIIDPSMGLERSNHCIANAKPSVWLWAKGSKFKLLKYVLPSLRAIPIHVEVSDLSLPSSAKELLSPFEVETVEHALVTFTTGSTGMPKLMLREHSFVLRQVQSLSITYDTLVKDELNLEEKDAVFVINLPVFVLHYLKIGALCLLYPNIPKTNPADVIKYAKKYNATSIVGSPAFVEKIATFAAKNGIMLPVRYTGVGGAPVFRGTLRTILSVTPDKKTAVVYGSTEAEPISSIFAQEKVELEASQPDGLCVGRPTFKGSVKVIKILEEPVNEPLNVAEELELRPRDIGEIIVSGWHVNTFQVDPARLVKDIDDTVWLRVEDAGYMDEMGRIWLVGRVKWRIERNGRTFWSTIVEQKILDRCSMVTFAAYLPHKEEAYLFLEAPKGLPDKEKAGIQSFLSREGIPVDQFKIMQHIPRDRRHQSKPDTAALFKTSNPNSPMKILRFVLQANPLLAVGIICLQVLLILCVLVMIFGQ